MKCVLSTLTVPRVVRMQVKSVQFIDHLDVLEKVRVERIDAEKAVQITT